MDTAKLFERVLAHFDGSPTKLGAAVGESASTVCNWRSRGIPANKAATLERLTGISVRELRPDDWQAYWPEPAPKRKTAKATA